ncbi:MAG: T9SS type A sorting domain-containing protein [Bacteroidales bacterium]
MKQRIYYRIMKVTQTFPVILWLFFSSFLFATYTHAQTIKGEQSTEGITIFKLPTDPDQMWELTKEGTDSGIRSNGNYPPIWEHPVNTGTIHNYIVNLAANPRVNNIPLQPGDWMGGFYLDDNNVLRCGGSRMWTGTENVMITLFGDDNMTPEKDGFDFGELIEFRFFLQQTQKEYVVSIASYHVQLGYVTNGRWYPLSLSMFMDMKAVCAFDFYIQASENPTCIGNQVTLSAEEFVGTGGPYTYSWSSIPEGFNYNIKNPPPITLNVTTDFFLTVTAPNNISNHQITLLVHDFPTANAGSDGTICENEIFNVSGTSTNAFSVLWETNGDGSFTNPTKASTNYTPGPIDKVNGTVELTFNAEPFSPCQTGASDNLTLTIQSLPTVDAGPDMNGCETLPLTIEATSTNYSSVQWTTSGTGTFSDPNSLITQYTPSSNDITNDVTLTVSVQSISPCQTTTSDNMKITFIPPPTCSAPTTIRRCEGTAFNLNGSVTNSSGILWTTQGDGTFANPEQLQTIYYPGPQDIENSGTQVTLTAYALPPCTMPATKAVSIIIQQLPRILTFGENTDFACNEIPLQLNAEVTQYNTISWSRTGDGTFNKTNILNPIYTPGPNDKTNGFFTLTLSATSKVPCLTGTTLSKTIYIVNNPTVEINTPSNQLFCAELQLQATANSYDSLLWITNGDGNFSNSTVLNPTYYAGENDMDTGANIKLTLVAAPIAPCLVAAESYIYASFKRPPSANAGNNATICENQTHTLNGIAQSYSTVQWETNGSGTFNNPSILNPVYTPSDADKTAGSVVLTLTAQPISPCADSASDQMILTIKRIAVANAGSDATICEDATYTLNGTAQRYSSVSWGSSGTGTFSNPSILKPVYTPSLADITAGSVVLTLTAQPISPCSVSASDQMILTIQRNAIANAGSDATICEDATYTMKSTAQRYSSVSWSSSGTGTFNNPSILKPVYTPSAADKIAGSVVLTLTAQPISPCVVSTSDQMILTIQRLAFANAGSDATICEDATYTLNGTAQRYSSVSWNSSGTGTFNKPSILKPVYTPSLADITAGSVVLTLTAQPISPCTVSTSDQMTLTIQRLATANAGDNVTICENETVTLNGTAQRYSSVSWSSSGTGTFNNPSILKPVYTPSEQDKNTGLVIITLTVQPISPCAVAATDYVIINIYRMPVVSAGNDAAICEDETITLNGTAQRYSSVSWSTSGTGTFNNPSTLKPVYTPSAADKTNGSVVLTLTVQPISPCSITASDQMTLFIENLNIIHNLEPTQTVNMGSTLNLVFEVEAHNDGIYTWFFNDEAIENSNNSIFTIPSISATDAGYYLCLFVHNCGEVSSNESFVQVIQLSAHEINLPQLWSGISSYVVPDNPAMNAIFAQIINNIEIVQNYDGIYWPSQNINTLGNWSTTKGYRIKMLITDQLMISGTVQYPVDELTLPPNWSIIPVNVPCIINTSEFFSDYPSILMIKEIAGSQIYWPEYNINSLVELLPGKAYEIYNSSSQPINITFPLCDGPLMNFEFKSVEPDIIHPWNPIYKTPISHIFGFLPEATGQFEQGDLIGIFTQSDLCAGIAKVEVIDKAFSLTAFGTDIFASDKTGFEYAEPVKFKIFKPTTGQEYPLNIQYSDGADESLFTANGITLIKKAECLMTNVESQSGLVKDFHVYVFPNPTTGNINITLTSNATFDGKFEIINTSGQLIQKVNFKHTNNNTTQSVDLSNNPAGIYYLRIIGENILKTRKILLR